MCLAASRAQSRSTIYLRGGDFCFEQDFAAFLGRCDFQGPSTFCDEFASGFFHRLNGLVIVIWIVMEKQKCLHFRIERK